MIKIITECFSHGLSVAGCTSTLYRKGVEGIRYMELRKIVAKEYQRLKSK